MTRENAAAEEGRARLIHTHTHTHTHTHIHTKTHKHGGNIGLLGVKKNQKKQHSNNATCEHKR